MKTIWKYPLEVRDENIITMPHGASVLAVQMQGDIPCLWALVDPSLLNENRLFRTYGTGHPFDLKDATGFVGTYQIRGLVFHVFERRQGH